MDGWNTASFKLKAGKITVKLNGNSYEMNKPGEIPAFVDLTVGYISNFNRCVFLLRMCTSELTWLS